MLAVEKYTRRRDYLLSLQPYGVAILYCLLDRGSITVKPNLNAMLHWHSVSHESPQWGEIFVARRSPRGLARIDAGLTDCILLSWTTSLASRLDAIHVIYVEMQCAECWQQEAATGTFVIGHKPSGKSVDAVH